MSSILNFSKANSVRIVRTAFDGLNYHDPDNLLFHQFSKPHVRTWAQPFQQNDLLYFQFESSFDDNTIELINYQTGEVVIQDLAGDPLEYEDGVEAEYEDGTSITFEGSSTSATEVVNIQSSYNVVEGYYQLTVPEGVYFLKGSGSMNDGSGSYAVESELIEVRQVWKNSVKFKYYSYEPNFGIDWRTQAVFEFRVLGDFMKISDQNTVENALDANTDWTKIRDFTTLGRILELYEQVPAWYAQKINMILSMDYVTIDDVRVISTESPSFDYENQGMSWVKPSWVLNLAENDYINRHDSSVRQVF